MNATDSKSQSWLRKMALRLWIWIGILTLLLWIYPVAYRTTRIFFLVGTFLFWSGMPVLWWRKKRITLLWAVSSLLFGGLLLLPSQPVVPESLAQDYCRGLRFFRGVRYVWGGEGYLGIDCSGLVRQGMIWDQVYHGLRTLNGQPIRQALWLWWNDCTAEALRDGFKGLTRECFRTSKIMQADHTRLLSGDLAITNDGVHVMAYLGNRTWIEADPGAHKVLEVTLPTDISWFHVPVIIVRWNWLDKPPTPNGHFRKA